MKNAMITASLMLSSLIMTALAHPVHHHRRALKVVTVTREVVEVEYITSTIYVDEPTSTSTPVVVPAAIATSHATLADPILTPTSIPKASPTPTPAVVVTPVAVATPVSTPQVVAPTAIKISTSETPAATPASTTPAQVFVAPVPTTTETPLVIVPTSTPTPTDAPATSATVAVVAAAATSSATSSGSFSGDGTFYTPGLGSCGVTSSSTDMIAALSFLTMDLTNPGNPNNNPMCGRKVRAFSETNTEGIIVSIIDTCAGCMGAHDLDFSPTAFDQLGLETTGRIPITWEFV